MEPMGNIKLYNNIHQWYYRGSLDSCNYSCSYCPFSKKPQCSRKGLLKDEESLVSFVDAITSKICAGKNKCAVQIVPYGEALIYKYYWRELARLTCSNYIEAAGAQTNLSFNIDRMLGWFEKNNGRINKLRLWCTFHPQMVTESQFLSQCRKLSAYGILYCVGTVGVPGQEKSILSLRKKLPEDVYLWINKMDGLGRRYIEEEIKTFTLIDEYFETGLKHYKADTSRCMDSLFVEADGSVRRCNTCIPGKDGKACIRKECSCYLSYCNQDIPELVFFNPYPAFRIPQYKKAVFFDIDGTLINNGDSIITENTKKLLKRLSLHSKIFLATSLPYKDALRKTAPAANIISGGVFAHGGLLITHTEKGDLHKKIFPLKYKYINQLKKDALKHGYLLHIYSEKDIVYKITLSFNRNKNISSGKRDIMAMSVAKKFGFCNKRHCTKEGINVIIEDGCIQIISIMAGKKEGIMHICNKMGYKPDEIAVFGNSASDIPMLKGPWFSVAVDAGYKTRQASDYCIRSGLVHA
ncbi:MAG: STM4011 family radical SAM protein [Lachnospiraceae bacterium]